MRRFFHLANGHRHFALGAALAVIMAGLLAGVTLHSAQGVTYTSTTPTPVPQGNSLCNTSNGLGPSCLGPTFVGEEPGGNLAPGSTITITTPGGIVSLSAQAKAGCPDTITRTQNGGTTVFVITGCPLATVTVCDGDLCRTVTLDSQGKATVTITPTGGITSSS